MKILMIAAECSPFIKVNGVADIINKLPISLKKAGVDVDVVIPYYKDIEKYLDNNNIPYSTVANARIIFNEVVYSVDVIHTIIPNTNVSVYFINEPNMISNGGVYFDTEIMSNEQDVINRFAFFSKAVFEIFIKKLFT